MQYDIYEAKIVKIANFFKFIFKHKIKIMLCFAFAFIITGTLLGTKGIIVKAESCPEEITYGEQLDWSAKAFLSDVQYEYREKDGDEWTTEHPDFVGEYYVRASAKALFGHRYSEENLFVIKPKPITVSIGKSFIYGDLPSLVASTEYKDTVSCDSFIYGEIIQNREITEVEAEENAIRIKNGEGRDVTACYVITSKGRNNVTLLPRDMTVSVADKSKVWDGTPLSNLEDEWNVTKGSFANGDTPVFYFQSIDFGTLSYIPTYTVSNADGEDVSAFYNIKFNASNQVTLTVTSRPVKVVTADEQKVYDGINLIKKDGFSASGLREGDRFVILSSSELENVGEIKNEIFSYDIFDISGKSVKRFYELDASERGTLKLTPRPLIINTSDATQVYNGNPLSCTDFTDDGLISGHTFKIISSTKITSVSESGALNEIFEYDIIGRYGSVKENYALTVNKGTLTVIKCPVIVTTGDDSKVYDATPFGKTNVFDVSGLISSHAFKVISSSSITNVSESGAKNEILEWAIVIKGTDDNSVEENYSVTVNNFGTLTVTARPITVYTASDSKEYDASPLKNSTVSKVDGIVEGHVFKITDSHSITNVSESISENNAVIDYDILDASQNSVKGNYSVSYVKGTLTITPRPIKVITGSDSKTYDGTALTDAEISVEGIISNGTVTHTWSGLVATGSQTEVGESLNGYSKDGFTVVDSLGNEVTENYKFVEENDALGTLKVTVRYITVHTSSAEKTYDATELTSPTYDRISGDGLAPGQSFTVISSTSITNVIESGANNEFLSFVIKDASGQAVDPNNYSIGYDYGTLVINARPITVTTSDYTGTYDGIDHSTDFGQGITVGGDGLATGHELSILSRTPMKNAVSNKDNVITFEIVDKDGPVDMSNYVFIKDHLYGKINIERFLLEIDTDSIEFLYDGTAQTFGSFTPVDPAGFDAIANYISDIQYTNKSSVTNAWEVAENLFELVIYDDEGILATDNYDVRIRNKGTLSVRARNIIICSEDQSFDYDANFHTWEKGFVTSDPDGLAPGHRVVYTFTESIRDAGSIENRFSVQIFSGNDPIDDRNYNFDLRFGTLTVIPRRISLTTGSAEKEWDMTPLTNPVWILSDKSENDLLNGHELYIPDSFLMQFTGSQTDVGESENTYVFEVGENKYYPIIRDALTKEDVTKNYDIEHLFGILKVTKRKITVYTSSDSKVYDGTVLTKPEYDEVEGLLPGHVFDIISSTAIINVKDSTVNEVYDYDVNDGTESYFDSYDVSYVKGTLTVTPRPVDLYTLSATKPYDGTELSAPGWDHSPLIGTHTVKSPIPYQTITEVGSTDNLYDTTQPIIIVDGENDVTSNYTVTPHLGVLEITPAIVYVTTHSDFKTYDGTPLSNSGFDVRGLKVGHTFVVYSSASITDVGVIDNIFTSYDIVDENGVSALPTYIDVEFKHGTLTVNLRKISLTTDSEKKEYDGQPLVSHRFEVVKGTLELATGHRLYVSPEIAARFTGSQTVVGTSTNTYLLTETLIGGSVKYYWPVVLDGNDVDVTFNYDFGDGISLGTLTVVASSFGLPEDYDPEAAKNKIVFTLTADTDGMVYLKSTSYGDYVGSGFEVANEYGEFYGGVYSASQILPLILDSYGYSGTGIVIEPKASIYALPYYASGVSQSSDVFATGDGLSPYYVEAYLGDYYSGLYPLYSDLDAYERDYRDFVYRNYIDRDDETSSFMRKIIEEEGFDASDSEIIYKVIDYIKYSATYSLDYDRNLDIQPNIAVSFLRDYKEGICQHYAAAATMLFRELGMPARYTIGYAVDVKAGEEINVSEFNAHAWVEVYVDSMGWVKVEVTGSSLGESTITLDPVDVNCNFDEVVDNTLDSQYFSTEGYRYYSMDGILNYDPTLEKLLAQGFSYEITFSGKQTGVGTSNYYVDGFKLISPYGRDVTDRFILDRTEGTLSILPSGTIEIYIHQNISSYTGNPIYADKYTVKTDLPDNMSIDITLNVSLTDIVYGCTENVIMASDINANVERYISYTLYVDGAPILDTSAVVIRVVNWDSTESEDYEVVKVLQREIHIEIVAKNGLKVGEDFDPMTDCEIKATMGDDVLSNFVVLVDIYDIDTSTVGSKDIRINAETFRILDSYGKDVSHNFMYYTEMSGIKIINVTLGKVAVTK